MPRLLIISLAASALLVGNPIFAQTSLESTIASSDALIASSEYGDSYSVIMSALRDNPSAAEREVLVEQLDTIKEATPYYINLDVSSTFHTGTRQGLWEDQLNLFGVPHFIDETLSVKEAEASLINSAQAVFGYDFNISPDLQVTLGSDAQIYFYEETTFMEAWVGEVFAEVDLNLGPILSNTKVGYGLSSKSREKVDFNPNVPRVPGSYNFFGEQDLGYKFAKDQVLGFEVTYRTGDETGNVDFPGTAFEHATVEAYYDATWADTLGTRVYGFGQAVVSDPDYVGFLALGAGVEMELELPVGFHLGGDIEYRTQSGYAPFPDRTADRDIDTMAGSLEIKNDHYTLGGFEPYLSAAFWDSSATYSEYTRSDLAFGAGIRLGF